MSDNQEHPPHVMNHMQDLGMSPPESDQTSPDGRECGTNEGLSLPLIPNPLLFDQPSVHHDLSYSFPSAFSVRGHELFN